MGKQLIRLTEGDLHRIVKESVNRILSEERPKIIPTKYPSGGHTYLISKELDNEYTYYHVLRARSSTNFLHKKTGHLLLKDDLPRNAKLLAYDFTNPNVTSPAWEIDGKMFYVDLNDKVIPYEGDVAE